MVPACHRIEDETMKRHRPKTIMNAGLMLGIALSASLALAQGPKTPVEAFNRLQGNAHATRTLQTKPLLHTQGTLLKTPGTKQLVRGQSKTIVHPETKVVTRPTTQLDTSKLFGKSVVPTHTAQPVAKTVSKKPVSWLGRVFAGFHSLLGH